MQFRLLNLNDQADLGLFMKYVRLAFDNRGVNESGKIDSEVMSKGIAANALRGVLAFDEAGDKGFQLWEVGRAWFDNTSTAANLRIQYLIENKQADHVAFLHFGLQAFKSIAGIVSVPCHYKDQLFNILPNCGLTKAYESWM